MSLSMIWDRGRVAAVLVAVAAIAVPWYVVARKLGDAHPPAATVRPTGLVWAGRVFTSQKQFEGWLRSRGASYAVWRRKHPQLGFEASGSQPSAAQAAASRKAGPTSTVSQLAATTAASRKAGPTSTVSQLAATTAAAATAAAAGRASPGGTAGSTGQGLAVALLLLGVVVAAAGLASPALLRLARPEWPVSFELRLGVVAVGVSLVLAAMLAGGAA